MQLFHQLQRERGPESQLERQNAWSGPRQHRSLLFTVFRSESIKACALIVAFCFTAAATKLHAQETTSTDPGAVQKHSNDTLEYYGLEKKLDENKRLPAPGDSVTSQGLDVPQGPLSGGNATFFLATINTDHSEILSSAEIRRVTSKYEKRLISFADLQGIVNAINELYRKKGFITAFAVLPPQKVVDGIVQIKLVEGRVGKIVVENNSHTKNSYFTKRVFLKRDDLIQVNSLEKSLTFFNRTNDVKIRAVLRPGEQFGTTDVHLDVQPIENTSTTLSFDNAGYDSIGKQRLGLIETDRSLFGLRDELVFGTYWAQGTVTGFMSYSIPVTDSGMRLGGAFDYDTIRVRSGPTRSLGVHGHFYDASLRLSQPFMATPHVEISVFVTSHFQTSILESQSFPLSRVRIRAFEWGSNFQALDRYGFWDSTHRVTFGTYNLVGNNSFVNYSGSITRVLLFQSGYVVLFRGLGQMKMAGAERLPPAEQIQIGGVSTVRGYPEGQLTGDSGYAVSSELDIPLPLGHRDFHGMPLRERFKGALFVDHGEVMGSSGSTSLTGAGIGVILNFTKYLAGRVNLSTPLQNRSGLPHRVVEFNLQTSPPLMATFNRVFRGR